MHKFYFFPVFLFSLLIFSDSTVSATSSDILTIAVDGNNPPFSWTQSNDLDGAIKLSDSYDFVNGYDIQVAKYIAESLNYDLNIIKVDHDSLLSSVSSNQADCSISAQLDSSEDRLYVNFSNPYFYDNTVVLLKQNSSFSNASDLSDLEGGSCTSVYGTNAYNECLFQIDNADIQDAIESTIQMLSYLENGKCDFVVTNLSSALLGCSLYPDLKILDFKDTENDFEVSEYLTDLCISVNKENADLLAKINETLESLSYDDMKKMLSDAISSQINLNIDTF